MFAETACAGSEIEIREWRKLYAIITGILLRPRRAGESRAARGCRRGKANVCLCIKLYASLYTLLNVHVYVRAARIHACIRVSLADPFLVGKLTPARNFVGKFLSNLENSCRAILSRRNQRRVRSSITAPAVRARARVEIPN